MPAELIGEYALCRDPNYGGFNIKFDKPINADKLAETIKELSEDLYRAKGTVPTPGGQFFLDYSSSGLSLERVIGNRTSTNLVVITRASGTERVKEKLGQFLEDYS